jgi:hypothetical protein
MERKDGIYDAQGRWIAPLEGNEALPPVPTKLCAHGQACAACSGLKKKAA